MNEPWITITSVAFVAAGLFAQLNLLRIFITDWRKGRREEQKRSGSFRRVQGEGATSERPAIQRTRLTFGRAATLALASAALVGASHAQESDPQPEPTPGLEKAAGSIDPDATSNAALEQMPKNPFSFQFNFDYTTAYFYHGIIQEDTGLILQPAAKLTVNLCEEDDFTLDVYFATWNSFHGQKTAAQTHGDFTEYWYESDLIGGLALTKGKFSLSTQYVILTSPSDAYETVQELDFTLSFDDSAVLGKFALHPYALIAIETGAHASDGANSDTGTYLELGIAPGFSFDMGKTPVSVSFPASVGLSLNDYYQDSSGKDDAFGFAQVGVKASLPLPFGERFGAWTLNAGVSAMFLGDHTTDFNGGQSEQLMGMIGLQLNF